MTIINLRTKIECGELGLTSIIYHCTMWMMTVLNGTNRTGIVLSTWSSKWYSTVKASNLLIYKNLSKICHFFLVAENALH